MMDHVPLTQSSSSAARRYTLSQKPTGPRWTMTGRMPDPAEKTRGFNPGPGAYTPNKHTYNPKFSMLPRRDEMKSQKDSPGPGAYNPDGKLRKQIPVSLGARNFLKDDFRETPGPGELSRMPPNI